MAFAAKRAVVEPPVVADLASANPTVDPPADPQASPALALQAELAARLSGDLEPGWSRRRTVAFAVAASGVLWVGVAALCAAVFA